MNKLLLGITYLAIFFIIINLFFGDTCYSGNCIKEGMENETPKDNTKETSEIKVTELPEGTADLENKNKKDVEDVKSINNKEKFFTSSKKSSSSSVAGGASQYYGWGLKDTDKSEKSTKEVKCPKCKHIYIETCPALIINDVCQARPSPPVCPSCKVCPDMKDYIKKSDVPPMPNMSDYIRKSDLPPMPEMSNYILKSKIPSCSVGPRPEPSGPVDQTDCIIPTSDPTPVPQKTQQDNGLCPNKLNPKCTSLIKDSQQSYEQNPYTYSIPNRYTYDKSVYNMKY